MLLPFLLMVVTQIFTKGWKHHEIIRILHI